MKEDMRKLNIMEDRSEDRHQVEVSHITSDAMIGEVGTLNKDEDDDDDNENLANYYKVILPLW